MKRVVRAILISVLIFGQCELGFAQEMSIKDQINSHTFNLNQALMVHNYSKAIEHQFAIAMLRAQDYGEDHIRYAIDLAQLARLYSHIGDIEQAREYNRQAIGIMEAGGHQKDKNYITMIEDMASWCIQVGDNAGAEHYTLVAEKLEKESGVAEKSPVRLFNQGRLLLNNKDYKGALAKFEEAKKHSTPGSTQYATIIGAIGDAYGAMGDSDTALQHYTEATDMLFEQEDPSLLEYKNYATLLHNIGVEYLNMSQYQLAYECFLRTKNVQQEFMGNEHPDYTRSLHGLIQVARPLGVNYTDYAFELYNNCKNEIRKNFRFLTEKAREQNIHNIYDNYFNTLYAAALYKTRVHMPDMAKLLYNTALLSKGLLLSTSIEFKQMIEETEDPLMLEKYNDLRSVQRQIDAEKQKPISERNQYLPYLEQQAQQLETELMRDVKAIGDYTSNLDLTWEDIAQSPHLGANDVAVEFVNTSNGARDYAIAVLRKGWPAPKVFPIGRELDLISMIGSSENPTGDLDVVQNGIYNDNRLYEKIWEPIKDYIHEGDRIYFAPSGLLHSVALEYLPVNKKGTVRMCDVYQMFRCSSTRRIAFDTFQSGVPVAHLYGDINYQLNEMDMQFHQDNITRANQLRGNEAATENSSSTEGSTTRGLRSISRPSNTYWSHLEGSRKEIEEIEPLLKSARSINLSVVTHTKSAAVEGSIKALSGKRSKIIHIATHGYYNNQSDANNKEHSNSLSRSALIFAGASNDKLYEGMDDGYLTAEEISLLDLRGTDLVVLSACQSGQGKAIGAEGLDGLQRAFKKAGVKTLIVSLWDVNDTVTQKIMVSFYKYYSEGYNWRKSFELALDDIRRNREYKAPKYWAPFVMID